MDIDLFVKEAAFLVKQRVAQAADTARLTIYNMLMPYTGTMPIGMMYATPGVYMGQEVDEERATKSMKIGSARGLESLMRMAKSSSGPMKKGLISDAVSRDFIASTSTCSNFVEVSGSASLTESSEYTLWADDFEHDGL